jgi:hypothetical protein
LAVVGFPAVFLGAAGFLVGALGVDLVDVPAGALDGVVPEDALEEVTDVEVAF